MGLGSSKKGSKLAALLVAATLRVEAAFAGPVQPLAVHLVVTDSGQCVLSGKVVALADLRARLRALKASGRPIDLHVTGGPQADYQTLMPAMRIVQEEGLGKVGLLTVAPPAGDPAPGTRSRP